MCPQDTRVPMGYFKEKVLHPGAFPSGMAWDSGMFLTLRQCPHMAPPGYPGGCLMGAEGMGSCVTPASLRAEGAKLQPEHRHHTSAEQEVCRVNVMEK